VHGWICDSSKIKLCSKNHVPILNKFKQAFKVFEFLFRKRNQEARNEVFNEFVSSMLWGQQRMIMLNGGKEVLLINIVIFGVRWSPNPHLKPRAVSN